MAPRAVIRSHSRTSIAVAALTVAVSVIVGVSVMIGSFRNTVADWLDTTLGADIYLSPPLITATRSTVDVDRAILDELAQIEGITRIVTGRQVDVNAPDYPAMPPVKLGAGSGEIAASERRFAWLDVPDYWAALEAGQVMVSEPFAFRRGISPENNTITLVTDRGPQTFTIAGVYYDYATDQGSVFMTDSIYRQYYDDPFISTIALFVADKAEIPALIDQLETGLLAGTDLNAQANRDLRDGAFAVFERAFSITGALQLLATVVAFIGILSALMALQLEHTREYGVMRATGMTPRQLWNYTLIQTGLMGTTAGLMALPIGLVLALVLIYVINLRSFGWTMALDLQPGPFIQAFLVAVIAALAAGLYPAWRLTRLVTARALRSE
jgi:putative ABC transport system permease protein